MMKVYKVCSFQPALRPSSAEEEDTYLATVGRHRWSSQIMMKVDKVCSFQQVDSSADEGRSAG